MITWLASYPRSGNTLYRMYLYHMKGIETYSIYNDHDIEGMGASGAVGHRKMTQSVKACAEAPGMFYVKTHGMPLDDSQAIYIVRDVRDTLVSYAHYMQDIDGFKQEYEAILLQLITGNRWGGWSGNVLTWIERPATVDIVKYEDMVEGRWGILGMGIEGDMPSFSELNRQWPQFFRKGRVGAWREEMSDNLEALCWHHHGKVMERLGYER